MKNFKVECDCKKGLCEAIYLNGVVRCTGCGKEVNQEDYISREEGDTTIVTKQPTITINTAEAHALLQCFDNSKIVDLLDMVDSCIAYKEVEEKDRIMATVKLKQIMETLLANIKQPTLEGTTAGFVVKIKGE